MLIQPYLTFAGRCEEALAFYQQALDAKPDMLMRFKDCPDPMPPGMLPPGNDDKVMHASFYLGECLIMADDGGLCGGGPGAAPVAGFHGFSLSITLSDEAEAAQRFAALAEGGQVRMPLGKTFWSPCFGMVVDRFGMAWMINVMPPS